MLTKSNKSKIALHGRRALGYMRLAMKELLICDVECNGVECNGNDFKYYKRQIKELISCDNGEAGLEPTLEAMEKTL